MVQHGFKQILPTQKTFEDGRFIYIQVFSSGCGRYALWQVLINRKYIKQAEAN